MTKKDIVQQDIKKTIIANNFKGIVLASMRVGKCRVILESIKELDIQNPKVLILYPFVDIKISWEDECKILNYYPNITYSTFISIEKVKDLDFDIIIADEAHNLVVETQLPIVNQLVNKTKHILLISGTYNPETLNTLKFNTGLDLIVNYSTEQAIKDELIIDYQIFIHQYDLDATTIKEFGKSKKWKSTDYKELKRLTNKIVTSQFEKEKFFHTLNRMRFINSCDSLVNCVNNWIKENQDKRFLLFTGDENVGKRYNLPMFNSKSKDNSVLEDFQNETINQLCLIRKGSIGKTYRNLRIILLTAINSNGENLQQQIGRSLLDDTEDAEIHIFVSSEQFQLKWLTSALANIPKNKIKYINEQ
jgi:superfamily II DNA or RNA helicase